MKESKLILGENQCSSARKKRKNTISMCCGRYQLEKIVAKCLL